MRTIVLDGAYMTDKDAAYTYIAKRMEFPSYFGKNLDALYDLLTEPCPQTQIVIYHKDMMLNSLGYYGQRILDTFRDALRINANLMYVEDSE